MAILQPIASPTHRWSSKPPYGSFVVQCRGIWKSPTPASVARDADESHFSRTSPLAIPLCSGCMLGSPHNTVGDRSPRCEWSLGQLKGRCTRGNPASGGRSYWRREALCLCEPCATGKKQTGKIEDHSPLGQHISERPARTAHSCETGTRSTLRQWRGRAIPRCLHADAGPPGVH